MKVAQKYSKHRKGLKAGRPEKSNPTIGEVVSISEAEMTSVWDRFKYGISREEMYADKAPAITEVVDTMRQMPIVGRDILTILDVMFSVNMLRNIPERRRNSVEADHRV